MLKTVFLLGAGASKKAGVPLLKDFLDEADKLLWKQNILDDSDKEQFRKVFQGIANLQPIHSKSKLDIYNLESVFAIFEMGDLLKKKCLGLR